MVVLTVLGMVAPSVARSSPMACAAVDMPSCALAFAGNEPENRGKFAGAQPMTSYPCGCHPSHVSGTEDGMLDGLRLDQLRFSRPWSKKKVSPRRREKSVGRSPAVSETMANLKAQLGVVLFDRSSRYPNLAIESHVLLADARAVVVGTDNLKARAKGMADRLEPELTAVIDVFFPLAALAEVANEFRRTFPVTPLRLYVEALGAIVKPVVDRRANRSATDK